MKTTLAVTNYNDEVIAKFDDVDAVEIQNGGVLAVLTSYNGKPRADYFAPNTWDRAHAKEAE
jgi:hypothetical protein